MKYLVLICDRPDDMTTLAGLNKPSLDRLARYSLTGCALLVPENAGDERSAAYRALLACDPTETASPPISVDMNGDDLTNPDLSPEEEYEEQTVEFGVSTEEGLGEQTAEPGVSPEEAYGEQIAKSGVSTEERARTHATTDHFSATVISDSELMLNIAGEIGAQHFRVEDTNSAALLAEDAFRSGRDIVIVHNSTDSGIDLSEFDGAVAKPLIKYLADGKASYKIAFVSASLRSASESYYFIYSCDYRVAGPKCFCEDSCESTALITDGHRLSDLILNGKLPEYGIGSGVTRFAAEIFELLTIALVCVMLIMTFLVRHSPVIGSSMSPTLETDDILIISDIYSNLKTGDIIIIQHPSQPTEPLVKRVIAVGGQSVKIDYNTWDITVDGNVIDSSYVNKTDETMRQFYYFTSDTGVWEGVVPDGMILAMGDNRQVSKDSRSLGYMDARYVIGKVKMRILPLDKIKNF